jgi:hypothetical protein
MKAFNLVGIDGNAFNVMGYTASAMRKAGYNSSEIAEYRKKATSGDYDMLLCLSMEMIDKCNEKLGLTEEEDDE